MSTRREGYVEYTRIDNSVRSAPVNSKIKYYVGIESDTGDYGLRLVSSPAELVRRYSTKSKPTAGDATSFLHAGKLLESQACYTLRVNKDCILPGMDSNGNILYFDQNYNKIDRLLTVDILPLSSTLNPNGLWIMIDNVFYYNSEAYNSEEKYTGIKYWSESRQALEDLQVANGYISEIVEELGKQNVKTQIVEFNSIKEFLDKVAELSEDESDQFISYTNASKLTFTFDISIDENIWGEGGEYFIQYSENIFRGVERKLSNNVNRVSFNNGKSYSPRQYNSVDPSSSNWDKTTLVDSDYSGDTKNFNEFLFSKVKKGGYLTINGYTFVPRYSIDTNSYPGVVKYVGDQLAADETPNYRDYFTQSIDLMLKEGLAKPDLVYTKGRVVILVPEGYVITPFEKSEEVTAYSEADVNRRTGVSSSWKNYLRLMTAALDTAGGKYIKNELYDYEVLASDPDLDYETQWKGNRTVVLEFDGKVEEATSGWINLTIGKYGDAGESGNNSQSYSTEIDSYKTYSVYIGAVSGSEIAGGTNAVDIADENSQTYNISIPSLLINALSPAELAGTSELLIDDLVSSSPVELETFDKYNGASTYSKFFIYSDKSKRLAFSWYNLYTDADTPYKDVVTIDKNDSLLNISFNEDTANEEAKVDSYYIKIKDTIFYNGDNPPSSITAGATYVNLSKSELTLDKFKELLIENIYNYFDAAKYNPYGDGNVGIILKNNAEEAYSVIYPTNKMEVVSELIDQTSSTAKFAVIQRFASRDALSRFIIDVDDLDSDLIHFNSIHNGISYTDDISFEPDKVNGYGTNVYYVKYNSLDRAFYIKELNNDAEVTDLTSTVFGDQIKPKTATINDYINAIETLEDEEFKGSILWDGGVCNPSYYKALTNYAEKCQAMVPVSIPKGMTTADVIQQWYAGAGLGNTPHQFVVGGYQRDVCFGDVYLETCPGYYYCKKVGDNTDSVQNEFQPIFHKSNGRVDTSDPLDVIPSKTDRETLLDNNINWIVRNKVGNYSYLNMNFTNQAVESAFSEEQNMRISNEIAHVCDDYIDNNTIGNYNVEAFRNTVQSTLDSQLRERIINNRGYNTVRGLKVVCDSTNNTEDIVANKLIVVDVYAAYGDSIRAAKVYSRTASLSEI